MVYRCVNTKTRKPEDAKHDQVGKYLERYMAEYVPHHKSEAVRQRGSGDTELGGHELHQRNHPLPNVHKKKGSINYSARCRTTLEFMVDSSLYLYRQAPGC